MTYFYAHLRSIHVYILLSPYAPYTCLYTSTPIYAEHWSTYFCSHLRPIQVYIYLCPYTPYNGNILLNLCIMKCNIILRTYIYICLHIYRPYNYTWLHISMPSFQYIFTYFYASICAIQLYILLRPYMHYMCLHTSMPIYTLHMFSYIYGHTRSMHVYILQRPYKYT
jgi:hypothetical protein